MDVVPRSGPLGWYASTACQPPVRQGRTDVAGTLLALETLPVRSGVGFRGRGQVARRGASDRAFPSEDRDQAGPWWCTDFSRFPATSAALPFWLRVRRGLCCLRARTMRPVGRAGTRLAAKGRGARHDGSQLWLASARQLAWFSVAGQSDQLLTRRLPYPSGCASAAANVVGDFHSSLRRNRELNACRRSRARGGSKVLDRAGTVCRQGGGALTVSAAVKGLSLQRTSSTVHRVSDEAAGFCCRSGVSRRLNHCPFLAPPDGLFRGDARRGRPQLGLDWPTRKPRGDALFFRIDTKASPNPTFAWQSDRWQRVVRAEAGR